MAKKNRNSSAEVSSAEVSSAEGEQLGNAQAGDSSAESSSAEGEQLGNAQAGEQLGEVYQLDPQSAELLNPDAQLAELEALEGEEAAENEQLRELLAHVASGIKEVVLNGAHLLRPKQSRELAELVNRINDVLYPKPKGT